MVASPAGTWLRREDIVPYLLANDLISPAVVVDGDVRVVDVSRRNSNHRVEFGDGGLLVKQAPHPRARRSLAHEATVLAALWASGDRRLTGHLPPLARWDDAAGLLVLGLAPPATRGLYSVLAGSRRFAPRLAAEVGALLARTHRRGPLAGLGEPAAPPTLSLHLPDVATVADSSRGALQLIGMVQADRELRSALDEVRRDWRPDGLVHGDAKWDNLLVLPAGTRRRLWLVDWELAGPGDGRWDVATVLASYLQLWVTMIPVTGTEAAADLPHARYPLAAMRPSMRALLGAWLRGHDYDQVRRVEELLGVARLLGARLVVTVFEYVQLAHGMWGSLVRLLQLAAHLLTRPEETFAAVLGDRLDRVGP